MTRSLNGGVDELPLPEIPGRLFLCGKHFIGPDPVAATARIGATTVVCLNQRYEQVRTDLPLEERLRIRSFQGEFHTLRGARQVKEKLD